MPTPTTLPHQGPPPLQGGNPFKIGLFSVNADGGIAVTRVPERWPARWDEIVAVVQAAEAAGIEFILPIARWKGFGGETDVRAWSFETLTHGAALGALTSRIAIFCTVHAPLVHPVFAAKALATIDHVSHGRVGLNIVCGWNQGEFDMFGQAQLPHDTRYDQGLEWYEVLVGILSGQGKPFDYQGRYYGLKGVQGVPGSLQQPRPVTMSAAFSPAGRDFAAKTSDFLFTTFADIEKGRATIADIEARGAALGRKLGVFTTTHVVCRETQAEAEAYYRHYAVDHADHGAVDFHMAASRKHAQSHDAEVFAMRQRFAGGVGTYPLVGTPQHIAEEMVRMHQAGFVGTTVSFVNFKNELPFFVDRVLPLLVEAGIRHPPSNHPE